MSQEAHLLVLAQRIARQFNLLPLLIQARTLPEFEASPLWDAKRDALSELAAFANALAARLGVLSSAAGALGFDNPSIFELGASIRGITIEERMNEVSNEAALSEEIAEIIRARVSNGEQAVIGANSVNDVQVALSNFKAALAGDFQIDVVLPQYHQVTNTMSALGAAL